eukprot:1182768-Prorocentrum_minimum.AAC.1
MSYLASLQDPERLISLTLRLRAGTRRRFMVSINLGWGIFVNPADASAFCRSTNECAIPQIRMVSRGTACGYYVRALSGKPQSLFEVELFYFAARTPS